LGISGASSIKVDLEPSRLAKPSADSFANPGAAEPVQSAFADRSGRRDPQIIPQLASNPTAIAQNTLNPFKKLHFALQRTACLAYRHYQTLNFIPDGRFCQIFVLRLKFSDALRDLPFTA
jgi:hypothetical protein